MDEEIELLGGGKIIPIAILRDGHAAHQFHHKERPASLGCPGIQDLGDIWVVHEGQGLALRFEAGDDLPGIHPLLDDF